MVAGIGSNNSEVDKREKIDGWIIFSYFIQTYDGSMEQEVYLLTPQKDPMIAVLRG